MCADVYGEFSAIISEMVIITMKVEEFNRKMNKMSQMQ